MILSDYILNGPSVVILADRRDPAVSWTNHLNRTHQRRGGVDLVAPVGTPVYAPTAGRMYHRPKDGSAGNSSRFRHSQNHGWADVFSHLSAYNGTDGQLFNQGDLIALTGDTGGVWPHLHRHLLDPRGIRRNPWAYFSATSPAALESIKIGNTLSAAEVATITAHASAEAAGIKAHMSAESDRILHKIQSTIRREVRGRLYRNVDTDEVVVADPTSGFWFPLADPAGWRGQVESLRVNPYQLIASDEVVVDLDPVWFDNLKAITEGHLVRISEARS